MAHIEARDITLVYDTPSGSAPGVSFGIWKKPGPERNIIVVAGFVPAIHV